MSVKLKHSENIIHSYPKYPKDGLIKEQKLPENKRVGFTAVEWGGVEIK